MWYKGTSVFFGICKIKRGNSCFFPEAKNTSWAQKKRGNTYNMMVLKGEFLLHMASFWASMFNFGHNMQTCSNKTKTKLTGAKNLIGLNCANIFTAQNGETG